MTRAGILPLLIVLPALAFSQDILQSGDTLVPVTYSFSKGKKPTTFPGRIQIRPTIDSVELWAFQLPSLQKIRKIKVINPREKLPPGEIQANASRSLDITYESLQDTSLGLKYFIPSRSNFDNGKQRFLSGRKATAYFTSQWVKLGLINMNGIGSKDVTFRAKRFLRGPIFFRTELLPGAKAGRLPVLDAWNCSPALERYFRLRKLQGLGLDWIQYNPYTSPQREVRRVEFSLFFEKNKADPNPDGLNEVIQYLKTNELVIIHAELEGATSVEGSRERNLQLQKERANVLAKALKSYSRDPVKSQLVLKENWDDFRLQIKNTRWAYLATWDSVAISKALSESDTLRMALEPIFITQRKAALKLALMKILSRDDQYNRLIRDLDVSLNKLFDRRTGQTNREEHALVMGIISNLFDQLRRGDLSSNELREILDLSVNPSYTRLLLGYHVLKFINRLELKREDWDRLEILSWIEEGQEIAIRFAAAELNFSKKKWYLKMCADFQAYSYQYASTGLIDLSNFCRIPYPNKPEFMGLILNQYAFLHLMSSEQNANVSCITRSVAVTRKPKTNPAEHMDSVIAVIRKELGIRETERIGTGRRLKVTFDETPKSAYYYLLKQRFLTNNRDILQWVEAIDGGSVELDAFNLYDLLYTTINRWDPEKNFFYDREVRLKEIDKLVTKMKLLKANICPPQINALYLSFHLKTLYYLEQYFEPGNPLHTRLAEGSLSFIMDYYKSRAKMVSPPLSLHVIKQFNLFNSLPGSKPGAWYGYNLLNAIAKSRMLNDAEMKIFAIYLKMYDPNLKNPLPMMYEKEKLIAMWNN